MENLNRQDGLNNLSRRKFLKTTSVLIASTIFGVDEVLAQNTENIIEKSKKFIGENELKNFLKIFDISENDELGFFLKVQDIQKMAGFSGKEIDGVLGKRTLRFIYKNFYSKMNYLPIEISSRLKFDNMVLKYSANNPRNLPLSGLKSAFDNDYFYGKNLGENLEGYFLNKDLIRKFGRDIIFSEENFGNFIKVEKTSDGKYFLAMYVDGMLEVLTYVSPGTLAHKTPQNMKSKVDFLTKYKISGSYPERDDGVDGGAVMPYSFEIDSKKHIYGHIGMVNGKGLSHGCVRVPAFYQQRIFDLLQEKGSKNFEIEIGELY